MALDVGECNLKLLEFCSDRKDFASLFTTNSKSRVWRQRSFISSERSASRRKPDARGMRKCVPAKSEAAKLEQARRVELASVAGKKASESPTHVSKRGKRRKAG